MEAESTRPPPWPPPRARVVSCFSRSRAVGSRLKRQSQEHSAAPATAVQLYGFSARGWHGTLSGACTMLGNLEGSQEDFPSGLVPPQSFKVSTRVSTPP
eukprot:2298292-Prymnesium_polylepis.1